MNGMPLFLRKPIVLRWVLALALCVACVATYARVTEARFVHIDDDLELVGNTHIQRLGWSNVEWMFTDIQQTERYTPLAWVVWAAIYQVWGLNPAAFHGLALMLHVVNTLLVFWLLMRVLRLMFGGDARAKESVDAVIAAMGAGLWAMHPLRVEVIGWATQVRFAEAATFALLCVLAYLEAGTRHSARPWRSGFYWWAVGAFAISLLFYPSGIGVVIVLMVLDVMPLRRASPGTLDVRGGVRLFVEKIPFVLPGIFVAAMTVYGRFAAGGIFQGPVRMEAFGVGHRVMQAFYIAAYYVWKPLDVFHLSPIYIQLFSFNPMAAPFVWSAAGVVGMTAAAIVLWRRAPWVMLAWVAHLALVFPFGGYFEHPHYPSDRYCYLQGVLWSVVICAALAWLWNRGWRRTVRVGVGMGVALVGLLCVLSAAQARIWHDNKALFTFVLAAMGNDPYRGDIDWRLAGAYLDEGEPAKAMPLLKETLRIYPLSPLALTYLEQAVGELANPSTGMPPDAVGKRSLYLQVAEAYDRAAAASLQVEPMRLAAKYYGMAGNWEKAAARRETAISMESEDGADRVELAKIYHEEHRDAKAREQLDLAVKSDATKAGERDRLLALWAGTGTGPATMR